jgi:undecaprenyl-diphosphatase
MTGADRGAGGFGYATRLTLFLRALAGSVLAPSPRSPWLPLAAQRALRAAAILTLSALAAMTLSAFVFDAAAIRAMPPRGAPDLWWLRLFTDTAKSDYLLLTLTALVIALGFASPAMNGPARKRSAALTRALLVLLLAVLVPVLIGDVLKGVIGRARPFVGGEANPFLFAPFTFEARFESLPSGHVTTAFAFAVGVATFWPKLRLAIFVWAILIALSRVVLLAHHPGDTVGGALVGALGATAVLFWFATRKSDLGFTAEGRIAPR